jgi:hypothetical protein
VSPWKAQMETKVQCSNAYGKTSAMSDRVVVKARSNTRLEARAGSRRPGLGPDASTEDRDEAIPEQLITRLNHALKNMADRAALNRNPLAHLAYVEKLANERYRDKIMPRGLALRDAINGCVSKICAEVGNEPGLEKACRYLALRASGLKCRDISSELGLAREHVSRTVRKRALELLAEEFLSVTRRKD